MVYISGSSSSYMSLLIILAWARRSFWNDFLVMALGGFYAWRTDVGCSSTTSAERAVTVVTNNSLADYFTIHVSGVKKQLGF